MAYRAKVVSYQLTVNTYDAIIVTLPVLIYVKKSNKCLAVQNVFYNLVPLKCAGIRIEGINPRADIVCKDSGRKREH